MRSEKHMLELIIGTAKEDDRIRAVYMNGSRTNPTVPKDIFQDYDIVYVVTETAPFLSDPDWIKRFGDLLMMQEPDLLDRGLRREVDFDRAYTYLMLFSDGNRIDLHIQTVEAMLEGYGEDKLTLPLLDKDECLPKIPPPSNQDYHVQKPAEGEFISYTNDFWWCLQNVAKGIWRDEVPYAKRMFEETTRRSLDLMAGWWIGIQTDFGVSTGKMGKYLKMYLPEEYWCMYKKTYSGADPEEMWGSVFAACELFRILAADVAEHFHFSYPAADDTNMTKYLKRVKELPADAKGVW
ncbi:aminoglycoside 6-adenylyltransferase [Jeotgalibacillus proteolyticus]|uniref:Aminoglycoside adenylyltransferase n=1 Tax=Jeotgalibacillus proteolyticus TaxID=2082395 RepID=A0A2S5GDI6_9BACL|nr:aminoglycoside 6-adenylyltransferase [Jeotgalibacillus proteolyticus]PPA70985.1 aminoglycoside adenylyltransferase [Jeotgalibacillus proteolyticus]